MNGLRKKIGAGIMLTLLLLLTGCGSTGLAKEAGFESTFQNEGEEKPVNKYVSEAVCIVKGIDQNEKAVDLYLIDRDENRTFQYDGTTMVLDKYQGSLSMMQLNSGDIVHVLYDSEAEKAGTIQIYEQAWSYDGIEKFNFNVGKGSFNIGSDTYSLDSNAQIFSEGRLIEADQIVKQDVLSIKGIDRNIYSIVVERGHGYLNLVNEEAVIGGWIEVGQTVIQQISPDIFLTVPEGDYTVRLTADGIEETRDIHVLRNKETRLDLADIEIVMPEKGRVIFNVTPEGAVLYIDEQKADRKYGILLPFGLHEVMAKASGYDTVTQYFYVEEEATTVNIVMDEEIDSTVSGNNIKDTSDYKVTVDTPAGVEVYQDNVYMGIAPVSFTKVPGSHTITLRRTGYITRSYTVQVEDDKKDVTYSFGELDPETPTVSGNKLPQNTVSGNGSNSSGGSSGGTVSGNTVSGNR